MDISMSDKRDQCPCHSIEFPNRIFSSNKSIKEQTLTKFCKTMKTKTVSAVNFESIMNKSVDQFPPSSDWSSREPISELVQQRVFFRIIIPFPVVTSVAHAASVDSISNSILDSNQICLDPILERFFGHLLASESIAQRIVSTSIAHSRPDAERSVTSGFAQLSWKAQLLSMKPSPNKMT